MFDRVPTFNKFLWCIDLRIGAFIVGILEAFGYLADFVTTFTLLANKDTLTTLDTVLLYLEQVFHLIGVFVAACLILGAWMNKTNLIAINVYGVFFITIITTIIIIDVLVDRLLDFLPIFIVLLILITYAWFTAHSFHQNLKLYGPRGLV